MSNPSLLMPMPEHNIRYGSCQLPVVGRKPDAKEQSRERGAVDRRIVRRFGEGVLTQGYTACPNLLLQHYAALGLSEAELVFVLQLWTYWWDTTLPHPSLGTIAQRMGKSVRQLQIYVEHLRRQGLLEVNYRHDKQGRQLSNSFDLSLLLGALEAIDQAPPDQNVERPGYSITCVAGLHERESVVGAGVQSITVPAPQRTSPKENTLQANTYFDSIPPTPIAHKPVEKQQGAAPSSPVLGLLQREMVRLSSELGDEAPHSSFSRAIRIIKQAALSLVDTEQALTESAARVRREEKHIRRRTSDGQRNAMPYFLAVLEQHTKHPRLGPIRERRVAAQQSSRVSLVPCAIPSDIEPMWGAILRELQSVIPPGTFNNQLARTRARLTDSGMLEVEAPSQFDAQWLDRMVRNRVEKILARSGHGTTRVMFVSCEPEDPSYLDVHVSQDHGDTA